MWFVRWNKDAISGADFCSFLTYGHSANTLNDKVALFLFVGVNMLKSLPLHLHERRG